MIPTWKVKSSAQAHTVTDSRGGSHGRPSWPAPWLGHHRPGDLRGRPVTAQRDVSRAVDQSAHQRGRNQLFTERNGRITIPSSRCWCLQVVEGSLHCRRRRRASDGGAARWKVEPGWRGRVEVWRREGLNPGRAARQAEQLSMRNCPHHGPGSVGELSARVQGPRSNGTLQRSMGPSTTEYRHAQVGTAYFSREAMAAWSERVPALRTTNRRRKPVSKQQARPAPGSAQAQHRCRWMLARFHLEHALTAACGDGAIHRKEAPVACVQLGEHAWGTVVKQARRRDAGDCGLLAFIDFAMIGSPDCLCPPFRTSNHGSLRPAAAAASSASPVKRTLRRGPLGSMEPASARLEQQRAVSSITLLHQLAQSMGCSIWRSRQRRPPHRRPIHQRRRGHRRGSALARPWQPPGHSALRPISLAHPMRRVGGKVVLELLPAVPTSAYDPGIPAQRHRPTTTPSLRQGVLRGRW